jgi:hypothetical protein
LRALVLTSAVWGSCVSFVDSSFNFVALPKVVDTKSPYLWLDLGIGRIKCKLIVCYIVRFQ